MTDEDFKLWFNEDRLKRLYFAINDWTLYHYSNELVTKLARKLANQGLSFNDIIYVVEAIGEIENGYGEDEC